MIKVLALEAGGFKRMLSAAMRYHSYHPYICIILVHGFCRLPSYEARIVFQLSLERAFSSYLPSNKEYRK